MKINNLSWVLLVVFLASCGNRSKIVEFKTEANITFNDSIYSVLKDYVNQFPNFNSFILACFQKKPASITDNSEEYNRAYQFEYLIGPSYSMENHEKVPIAYFKINDKLIFIKCGLEELVSVDKVEKSLYHKLKIHKGVDSVSIGNNLFAKDGKFLFLKRAIYFSIEDNKVIINYRPDTIFLPKYSNKVLYQSQ
ncbi:MAG TPA: hypothetical protein PK816_13405 [Candidatus Cloacimonadota bacterium]|nr:hypothetical protein [Candidatus Cloacimonadota bacterium]